MSEKDENAGLSRSGCLGLFVVGLLFVISLVAGFIYFVTRPQGGEIEAGERAAIAACWERAKGADSERAFTVESCQEMEKQFLRKFGHQP